MWDCEKCREENKSGERGRDYRPNGFSVRVFQGSNDQEDIFRDRKEVKEPCGGLFSKRLLGKGVSEEKSMPMS